MVAPNVKNQLTRSLVRVPNSGQQQPHDAILLDLSRVSPAAALVPVMHGLPENLFTTGRPTPPRSTPLPMHGLVKPSEGSTLLLKPQLDRQPAVRNGLVHQGSPVASVSPGPTSEGITTSSVERVRATCQRRLPLQAANGNVTPGATPSSPSLIINRKRPFPVIQKDAPQSTTTNSTVSVEGIRSAKVPKTAAPVPRRESRRAPSLPKASIEQLHRKIDQLRSENETLRSEKDALRAGYEAYRNYYLSLHQRRLASVGSTSGMQVH